MRTLLLATVCALAAGCPSNLEEQSHVSKLRVLAVRADPPELVLSADAGLPTTTLTALAVEPAGAPVTVAFALCREITSAPSPTLPCPGDAGIELPSTGPHSARLDLNDERIIAFALEAQLDGGAFDAGSGVEQTLAGGVSLLVGFTATAGAQEIDGFATLTLRSDARGPPDVNPPPFTLEIGDSRGVVAPNAVVRLQPRTPPKLDESMTYGFTFFSTAGSISALRSTDRTATGQEAPTWVEWTAPPAAQPDPVRFWVVLRDGRGGTTWTQASAEVR